MKCEIIQDLLPLYHDGVCSAESRAAVEEHLPGCGKCRRILADMDAPLPEAERRTESDTAAVKRIAGEWKRGKWRSWLKGAAAAVLACALLAGLWGLATQWMLFPVAPEDIKVTDLRQLSDGRILYRLRIEDGRSHHSIRWEFGEEGDLWIVPKRALFKELRDSLDAAESVQTLTFPILKNYAQSSGVETEIIRIWYGDGEDRILVWEEGMDLPAASARDEASWGFDQKSAEYWANRQS